MVEAPWLRVSPLSIRVVVAASMSWIQYVSVSSTNASFRLSGDQ